MENLLLTSSPESLYLAAFLQSNEDFQAIRQPPVQLLSGGSGWEDKRTNAVAKLREPRLIQNSFWLVCEVDMGDFHRNFRGWGCQCGMPNACICGVPSSRPGGATQYPSGYMPQPDHGGHYSSGRRQRDAPTLGQRSARDYSAYVPRPDYENNPSYSRNAPSNASPGSGFYGTLDDGFEDDGEFDMSNSGHSRQFYHGQPPSASRRVPGHSGEHSYPTYHYSQTGGFTSTSGYRSHGPNLWDEGQMPAGGYSRPYNMYTGQQQETPQASNPYTGEMPSGGFRPFGRDGMPRGAHPAGAHPNVHTFPLGPDGRPDYSYDFSQDIPKFDESDFPREYASPRPWSSTARRDEMLANQWWEALQPCLKNEHRKMTGFPKAPTGASVEVMVRYFVGYPKCLKDVKNALHPDKFLRCPANKREEFVALATDIFKAVDEVYQRKKASRR